MLTRRRFFKDVASGTAGLVLLRGDGANSAAQPQQTPSAARRQVLVGGRRVKVVDVHAHCAIPEIADVVRGTSLARSVQSTGDLVLSPARLRYMDTEGIDVQVLSINTFWYATDRELVQQVIRIQNEKLAAWCAAHPDRFVGLASVALQHPDLAADQLDEAVKKLGLRGVAIGGSVDGEELSARRFDPFWAKAEELGVIVFMHPQAAPGTTQNTRLQGKGGLGNTIGNPLETTVFLSHLIFEGTLDRFPQLKICAAHAGGYLPSYSGRSDALCGRGAGDDCRALKKRPSEYFQKELFVDTMVFHQEGLRHLVAELGVGQIMYGTDYPYDWPVGVDFVLNAPFLSDREREAILGGNASALLRIVA
jgi:aminocarboxymuconate-semialdehyde decarboxylase